MANTINYGSSGRGGKNPYKTLTSAQRSKASVNRRAEEEEESGRISTPRGVAGSMLALTPFGMAKAFLFPAKVGKSLISKGLAKASSSKNATKAPNALVKKLQSTAKTGNEVATQGSRAVATQGSRAVATQGSRAVATQGSRAVAKRPSGTVAKRPSDTVAKRPSGDDKGKIVGLSNKGKAAAAAAAVATAAGIDSLVDSEKKTDKPLSKLPTKTVAKRKEPVPVKEPRSTIKDVKKKPEPPKAEVQGPENKPLKPLEGGVRYIDNPFGKGKIKVDSSDAAFNMEPEFSGDYKGGKPGMKKNVVKRKAGGKIGRGCGAAMRGGGKVMR
jgi:hypothetical protein